MTRRDLFEIAAYPALEFEVRLREDERVHTYLFKLVPMRNLFVVQPPDELYRPHAEWDAAPACEAVLAFERAKVACIKAMTSHRYEVVPNDRTVPSRLVLEVTDRGIEDLSTDGSGNDLGLVDAAVAAMHKARVAIRDSIYP